MRSQSRYLLFSAIIALVLITGCSEQLAKSHFRRGEVYWRRGNSYSAIKELKTALQYNPSDKLKDKILILISTVAHSQPGNLETAIWANKERLKITSYDDTKFDIYLRIAEIYENHLKQYSSAINTYRQLLDSFPQHEREPNIRFKITKNYINLEKYEEAEKETSLILTSYPKAQIVPRALYQLGNIAYLRGDYSKALKYFEEVTKKYPGDETEVFARFGIGNCLEEKDRLKEAISAYKSIKQKYPNQPIITHKIVKLEKRVKSRGR